MNLGQSVFLWFILCFTLVSTASVQVHFDDGDDELGHGHDRLTDILDWTEEGRQLNDVKAPLWNLTSLHNTTFHSTYHTLKEINKFIDELVKLHPGSVKRIPLGHSGQGREMYALRIKKPKSSKGDKKGFKRGKKGVMIMGAQHAREVCSLFDFFSEM